MSKVNVSKKKGIKRGPVYVRDIDPCVWFYEAKKSIEVYIHRPNLDTASCRIPRHLLVDWINRTKG